MKPYVVPSKEETDDIYTMMEGFLDPHDWDDFLFALVNWQHLAREWAINSRDFIVSALPQPHHPVGFEPWKDSPDTTLTCPTAIECVTTMLAVCWEDIFPQHPDFSPARPFDEYTKRIDTYLKRNRKAIDKRMKAVKERTNGSEWLRLLSQLQIERSLVLNKFKLLEKGSMRYSPILDANDMVKLLKGNNLSNSDRQITRKKQEWRAESIAGTNNQKFRFQLNTLKKINITFPPEWEDPAK